MMFFRKKSVKNYTSSNELMNNQDIQGSFLWTFFPKVLSSILYIYKYFSSVFSSRSNCSLPTMYKKLKGKKQRKQPEIKVFIFGFYICVEFVRFWAVFGVIHLELFLSGASFTSVFLIRPGILHRIKSDLQAQNINVHGCGHFWYNAIVNKLMSW